MEALVQVGCRVIVPFGRAKYYTAIVSRIHEEKPDGYTVKSVSELIDTTPILLPSQLEFWQWMADYYLCALGDVYKAALPAGLKLESDGEEIVRGFKPKEEARVRLGEDFRSEDSLHALFDSLRKAPKQLDLLMRLLELSNHFGKERKEVSKHQLMKDEASSAAAFNALVGKGVFQTYMVEIGRLSSLNNQEKVVKHVLNAPQQKALEEILQTFQQNNVCLLHGVTSSGKTEIYIQLIEQALAEGKQVLYLLPEIALTTQITQRLQRVFGNKLGIYHSKFSDNERVEIWQKQLSDEPFDVILGVRSSVFLPFQRLGLVIVDEEHENTYKQQDPAPRYHARNAAIMLAHKAGAKTLLGTATPSIESWYNATEAGKYGLVQLTERYRELQLPEVKAVDIHELRHKKLMHGAFSPDLLNAMRDALGRGEQVILFQNRRGFAPMIECHNCGWIPRCVNCDVTLTYHRSSNQLVCHYCGHSITPPQVCPACEETDIRSIGAGTERVEEEIKTYFPEVKVARMDLDTTRSRSSYEQLIHDFEQGKTRILIGTQMISKGLDFGNVSVVGILNADLMLSYPDFRAYERAFQLMAQVAGRAGRKNKRGLVLLQTSDVKHPIIDQVRRNDYEGMVEMQLAERQMFRYPPYYRMVYVYLKNRNASLLDQMAQTMATKLRLIFGDRVMGPDRPPVARVQKLFIRKIMLKFEMTINPLRIRELLLKAQQDLISDDKFKTLAVYYDVDPA